MNLLLEWEGSECLILRCSGEIGWNGQEELVKRVGDALDGRDQPRVVLDLERVDVVTSAGIGCLLQLWKLISDRGGTLVMACVSPILARLFKTVGLDRYVRITESLAAARVAVEPTA